MRDRERVTESERYRVRGSKKERARESGRTCGSERE